MKINCAHDELVELHKLQLNPKNPNKHPEKQITLLAKIIDYQGQRSPIVVSTRSGFITKGHGRLEAIKSLGWDKAAIDYQDYDNEAQEYADMVADNKIAELAEHDDAFMFDTIKNLDLSDLPSLDLLGIPDFEMPETEVLDPQCDEDEVPENVETRSKPGDIWQLGRHRLMCGDSTSVDAIEKLLSDNTADLVFTDPPYGISLGFETPDQAKARKRRVDGLKVQNDNLQGEDLLEFLRTTVSNAVLKLKNGGPIYVCSPIGKEVRKFIHAMEDAGIHYQAGLVWNKSSFSLSRFDYQQKHEIIHYGWKKGAVHIWEADRKQTTVYDFQKPSRSELHPTTKPVELIEYFLTNSSKSGNLVLDVFGGSGSTLIACEKTNRKCFMMELDPKYCDVILARWEKYTGKTAERLDV